MTHPARSLALWKSRHGVVAAMGIGYNLLLAVPLLIAPEFILSVFGIPAYELMWPRFAGGLLIILSCFYAPMVVDLDRFRILAWLQIFPSRLFGVLFFLISVVGFGAPTGFLVGALLDGLVSLALLYCLIRITKLEQALLGGDVS